MEELTNVDFAPVFISWEILCSWIKGHSVVDEAGKAEDECKHQS